MYKHQDPLNKLYTNVIRESGHQDYRSHSRDKTGRAVNRIVEPGQHLREIEEVVLKDGSIVPVEIEFVANWGDEDHEWIEGRGRFKTSDAGFDIQILKAYIPASANQKELDEWTGKPGMYTPGLDVLPLISPQELKVIERHLDEDFNDRTRWGTQNHYQADPRDSE